MTTSYIPGTSNAGRSDEGTAARNHSEDTVSALELDRAGLLISIQPRYAKSILDGQKMVELRRRPPKTHPAIALIYGSGRDRSVLGTARIEAIHTATPAQIWRTFGAVAGVTRDEFDAYFAGCDDASALELNSPERATHPLPLEGLRALGLEPPQSWRYINAEQLGSIVGSLHPQSTTTNDAAVSRNRPLGWALRGVKPFAAFGLRCVTIGLGPLNRPSDPITLSTLDHTLMTPTCYLTPGSTRSSPIEHL